MSNETLTMNQRMPFMRFNWAQHAARTGRLTHAERGFYDLVRSELWGVVGALMPLAQLKLRLRVAEQSPEATMLSDLIALGLLKVDQEGRLFDEVQVAEFAEALLMAERNRSNGAKGGRPKSQTVKQMPREAADPKDF